MRSRSNSGVRLDYYQMTVQKTILRYQVCSWQHHPKYNVSEVVYNYNTALQSGSEQTTSARIADGGEGVD